jgi:repressor LexA
VSDRFPAGLAETAGVPGAQEFHDIQELLIDSPVETVLVTIRGDSMIDAGILDGDIAIVRRNSNATTGDFVVALVDGGFTLKELGYRRGQPALIPQADCTRPSN